MINKLIHFSVYHRGVVLFFTALLVVAGIISFQHLPIDAVPDITNNQVQVNTTIEGLVPEEIERTVTFPVESAMRGMAGVQQVRSITRFGLSQVRTTARCSLGDHEPAATGRFRRERHRRTTTTVALPQPATSPTV